VARLIISAPDGKHGIMEITKVVVTIGRGNANDLVLNDSSVSRFHAVLKCNERGEVSIADRSSTNGVILNGERIRVETPLQDGDALQIGKYEARFEAPPESQFVVKPSEIPSTLDHVLKRDIAELGLKRNSSTPTGTMADMIAQIKKLERENYLLTMLYDAGRALSSKLSVEDIGQQVVSLALRIEGVERGFMLLFDELGQVSHQTEVRYRNPVTGIEPKINLSRTVLEAVRKNQQPLLINDARADDRFAGSDSLKIAGLRSAICAPLVGAHRLLGVLYVDNLEKAAAFTQEELNVIAVVAAQAAAAIDNAEAYNKLANAAVQRSALERFLSPEVVEMVAVNPDGVRLGGVNQKVTILFADIRGFTSISETFPPEKVVEILNEYFTRVTDVIFDHGGTLDKYLGDGVMAIFGAPISKGNDAANAVRAAQDIQRLLGALNRDAKERGWPDLRVGIGVTTGNVIAGNIGSPKRLDYTVVGDTVNVAARLMAHAAGGQILISQSTAYEIGSGFDLTSLTPLLVKGKSEPLAVFSVNWRDSATATHKLPTKAKARGKAS
jgi:adenylate cyclase